MDKTINFDQTEPVITCLFYSGNRQLLFYLIAKGQYFNALSVGFKLRPFDLRFFQFNFKDVQTVDRRIVEPSTLGGSTGPG